MILKDLLELINKEKRRKERVKAARKFAIGMGVVATVGVATGIVFAPKSGKETREDLKNIAVTTVETVKERVQKKAETVKHSAANAAQEVLNVVKDIHEKAEGVKKHNKDGHNERQDS
jgi:gas vesicle protein